MKPFCGTAYDLKRVWEDVHNPVLSLILVNQFKQFDKALKPLMWKAEITVKLANGEELLKYVKENINSESFAKRYIFEVKDTITLEQLTEVQNKLQVAEATGAILVKYRNSSEVRSYVEDSRCPDWFSQLMTGVDFALVYDKTNNQFGCEKHRAIPSLMSFVFKDL